MLKNLRNFSIIYSACEVQRELVKVFHIENYNSYIYVSNRKEVTRAQDKTHLFELDLEKLD